MSISEENNSVIEATAFSRAQPTPAPSRLHLSPAKVAIWVVFISLAIAALFMFTARAVQFDFEPGAKTLAISGGLPTYQIGERYLMQPGNYEIEATQDGYHNLQTQVSITRDASQNYHYILEKLPGLLSITTRDETGPVTQAEIYIDQKLLGETPITIKDIAAGTRDLYVNHPRYLPYQTDIEIEGKQITQESNIILAPAWAEISFSSIPSGADIFIDGSLRGTTPVTVEIIQGERNLELKKPGYKSWATPLVVAAQVNQVLPETVLVKSDGKLNIQTNPDKVNITISGHYYGQTPLSIALAPNENYQLLATRAGFENVVRSFAIRPDEDQSFNFKLTPIVGILKLEVFPSDSVLFIDGKKIGNPNQTLNLTARQHRILIEHEGYASYETDVIPQPSFAQQLKITLLTTEAARVSAIPEQYTTSLGDVLRFIVPGKLNMGAGRREPGRRSNEIEKDVTLTRSFYIGEKEISNESFKAFDPGHDSGILGRALLSENDRPVVNVSWEKAVRFCNWLSGKDGLPAAYKQEAGRWVLVQPLNNGYRLPTEAEWAWTARYSTGQASSRFPWGNNMPPPPGAGNFADETAANMVPYIIQNYNDKFRGPAPPGSFKANELGIFDLAGNVSEWVHDYYSVENYREPLSDPIGPTSGDYFVIRGSNYTHGRFSELRWTFRDYGSNARPDVGFRIARYLE